MLGYIHGAHHPFLFLEHQYSLQVVLAGLVQCQIIRPLSLGNTSFDKEPVLAGRLLVVYSVTPIMDAAIRYSAGWISRASKNMGVLEKS